jgi:predicted component of type VI protein secretion system
MPVRLVALDEGPDIPLDREMLVVGRHPQCDARLDSIRVSRRHCCMTPDNGEIIVKDLGSTNGIRINGQRVEKGRLRPGDELSIAHIRYRFEDSIGQEMTMAEPLSERNGSHVHQGGDHHAGGFRLRAATATPAGGHAVLKPGSAIDDSPLAAAVRELLPSGVADKCRIQVIVQMPQDAAEDADECRPDSSL